ncbi:DUF1643 domain-containing protein [Comamonas testosteroni]|uniref:DUF1643 domain-containing protein n=1 Tax=Comamonas testosteroni TaxID=285 RepID=UPI0023AB2267|nr:DUF1643 domain-containing protein [Comamonas testosteroni]WEE79394.1 DUF1643 domain-containing protein [Comamonas testosteroni]
MSAIISPCGNYRYRLEREVPAPNPDGPLRGKVVAFFGINPSTADADVDDATVRKWRGFCQRWGVARFIVGNVFAYRATDVKELATAVLNQKENLRHQWRIAKDADIFVPCWGSRDKLPRELHSDLDDVLHKLLQECKPVMTFGLTASGDPKHPLMLGYDTKLQLLAKLRAAAQKGQ